MAFHYLDNDMKKKLERRQRTASKLVYQKWRTKHEENLKEMQLLTLRDERPSLITLCMWECSLPQPALVMRM